MDNYHNPQHDYSQMGVDKGYPLLVIKFFKTIIRFVKNPDAGMTSSVIGRTDEEKIEWLEDTIEWAENRKNGVWFTAWEDYFGYNADVLSNKIVREAEKSIDELK